MSSTRWAVVSVVVVGVVLAGIVGGVQPVAGQSSNMKTLTITAQTTANQQISGVTIIARWDGGSSRATTAGNGKAFVDVRRARTVNITIEHPDYTRNRPFTIEPTAQDEHTITIYRKSTLDVTVSDSAGPLADATVELRQGNFTVVSGQTDDDGAFDSGTIAQGQYTLTAVKPGYRRTTREITVAGAPSESLRLERGTVTYDVRVVDSHFDPAEPVAGATVSAGDVAQVQTNQNGFASVALPVNTELRFEFSKDGYGTKVRSLDIGESGEQVNVTISRQPSLTISALNERVVAGERVAVDVMNAYDEPAAGVAVLVNGSVAAETDDSGRATVLLDETGTYELRARAGPTTSDAISVEAVDSAEQVTTTETETPTGTETTTTGPGFGVVVALLALSILGLAAVGRRRD